MSEAQLFYSRPILDAIGDGIMYSDLLCDKKLISSHGTIGGFVDAVQDLADMKAIRLEDHWSPEEGDDFKMSLTDRGRFLRRYARED